MTYAVSDLHGCYDKFMKLLELIHLTDEDTLFVLGDVVDRGPQNVPLILELASKKNYVTMMGNHDYLAGLMLKTYGLERRGQDNPLKGKEEATDLFEAWLSDGGESTWKEFLQLSEQEQTVMVRFLENRLIRSEFEVDGRLYHLSHTVPERHLMMDERRRAITDYLFERPEYNKIYFEDKTLVTGHTPTGLIEEAFAGRIWRKNNHIAIDCGAVFGGPLGCICLETGEEFYAN